MELTITTLATLNPTTEAVQFRVLRLQAQSSRELRAKMERRLYKATVEGDVTSLLDVLRDDPLILDRCMVGPYSETPLHIAAMLGHEKFVAEILKRKPELAGEPDARKYLPLHLAVGKGYLGIVKKLMSVNPDACYARDRYTRNPLHVAALKGRVQVLKELVRERPNAARDRTSRGETILHLCVRNYNLEALKLLVEIVGDDELVNSKNDDGDTILHLAAIENETETLNFLMSSTTININTQNHNGFTAHDILAQIEVHERLTTNMNSFHGSPSKNAKDHYASFESEIEPAKESYVGAVSPNANTKVGGFSPGRYSWKRDKKTNYDWLERKKSALMVVASLTATMAFQIGVNPPGGFWQDTSDGHTAGFSVMANNYPARYPRFLAVNTLSFIASLSIILLLVSGLPLRRRLFMWILMLIMWIAITSIALTYVLSIYIFTPSHERNAIYKVIALGTLAWIALMVLLLIGHTIRMIVRAVRSVRKVVKQQRRSSSSTIMHHGHV